MNKNKSKYERPEITKVKFEDKDLVAFHVCRKQSQLQQDSGSCCNILPFNDYNLNDLDPS